MFGTRFAIKQISRREEKRNREEKKEQTDEATVLLNLGDRYYGVHCIILAPLNDNMFEILNN